MAAQLAVMPGSTRAAELIYHATPRGSHVVDASGTVGAGDPDGSYNAGIDLQTETNELCSGSGRLRNLGTPTEAYLHQGPAGTNGPVVVTLPLPPQEGAMATCMTVPPEVIEAIVADPASFYIELHTDEFPDGAARAQLDLTMCTLVGWGPDMDQQGEGASDLNVYEGQRVQLRGNYWEGANVTFALTRGDDVKATGTATSTFWSHDWFFTFEYEDAGDWTFSATVPGIGQCEDVMAITVNDAGAGPVDPGPQPLPDTAATGRIPAPPLTLAGLVLLAAAAVIGALRPLVFEGRVRLRR
jgi:hypothetical protein